MKKILLTSMLFVTSMLATDGPYIGAGISLISIGEIKDSSIITDQSTSTTSNGYSTSYDSTLGSNIKLGFKLEKYRVELEQLSYSANANEHRNESIVIINHTGSADYKTTFVSMYVELDKPRTISNLTPFIGAGFGSSKIDIINELDSGASGTFNASDSASSFHISAGMSKPIRENITVECMGRLISNGSITGKDSANTDITYDSGLTIALTANLKFQF